jgi:hypothetical protein
LLANVLPAMLDHMAKATDAFDEADDPDASRGEDGAGEQPDEAGDADDVIDPGTVSEVYRIAAE